MVARRERIKRTKGGLKEGSIEDDKITGSCQRKGGEDADGGTVI